MSKQLKLRWSVREKDWIVQYPDGAANSMMGVLFDMTKTTGHRTDWEEDLKKMLTDRGYDYRTFKITVNKIKHEPPKQ